MHLLGRSRIRLRRAVTSASSVPLAIMLAGLSVIAAPTAAQGQIATDRPDFVESSLTVGSRTVQVESSVAYQRSGSAASRTAAWSTPTLVRWGLGGS